MRRPRWRSAVLRAGALRTIERPSGPQHRVVNASPTLRRVIGRCESCGSEGEELIEVRRLYVTPEAWDTEGKVTKGDIEQWCFVCRTHYPHEAPPSRDA